MINGEPKSVLVVASCETSQFTRRLRISESWAIRQNSEIQRAARLFEAGFALQGFVERRVGVG
jgi:hypothetical protein